jgi:hypothetical protein
VVLRRGSNNSNTLKALSRMRRRKHKKLSRGMEGQNTQQCKKQQKQQSIVAQSFVESDGYFNLPSRLLTDPLMMATKVAQLVDLWS